MSVTAAAGFRAGSAEAGLAARGGVDLTVVINDGDITPAACVFTTNKAKAHPIVWSQQVIASGEARAIVLNAGGANCFTGPEGFALTHASAETLAGLLENTGASEVLVCSTGLIGELLPAGAVLQGIERAVALADNGVDAGIASSQAILTTDSHPKTSVKTLEVEGGVITIGGMAKGAGMLAPGLATMLVVITTDAVVAPAQLDRALRAATRLTFDRLDSDGAMSTNDQVTLMASGASGLSPDETAFGAALTSLCADLAQQLLADAEGSSHDITITVTGAHSEEDAVKIGRAVARNNLFKAAMFGQDPNWGRVLAAIGTVDAECDVYAVDVSMNGVRVCHAGAPDRPRSEVDLEPRAIEVLIELHAGSHQASIWTNDLTHAYVHENSAYSS